MFWRLPYLSPQKMCSEPREKLQIFYKILDISKKNGNQPEKGTPKKIILPYSLIRTTPLFQKSEFSK